MLVHVYACRCFSVFWSEREEDYSSLTGLGGMPVQLADRGAGSSRASASGPAGIASDRVLPDGPVYCHAGPVSSQNRASDGLKLSV